MPKIQCLECPHMIFYSAKGGDLRCVKCETEYEWVGDVIKAKDIDISAKREEQKKRIEAAKETGDYSDLSAFDIQTLSTEIILTTGFNVANRNIEIELEIISAECVYGLHLFKDIFAGNDLFQIATEMKRGVISEAHAEIIKDYFDRHDYAESDYQCFLKFVSDYTTWGGGKTIDRDDYFISALMKAGNLLAETQSAIAEIAKLFFNSPKLWEDFHPTFIDPKRNNSSELVNGKSIGPFVHKLIDFLLKHNLQTPLFNNLVEKNQQHGSYNLEYDVLRLTSFFKVSDNMVEERDLISGDKLRFFIEPFDYESKYYYLSNLYKIADLLNFYLKFL